MKKIIVLFGPPGSGKGTQASLIASNFNLSTFDTGKYIEQTIHAPENLKNKIIRRERENFDSGKLCTPSWVLSILKEKTSVFSRAGLSIIFTGSPRTLYEAFGDSKQEGLVKFLEKHYGKKNIHFVYLNISPETSIWRNSHRKICITCSAPILYKKGVPQVCPFCGSPVRQRSLDKPEVIKVRLKEYKERTFPIIERLKKAGYKINFIDGEKPPYIIYKNIISKLKLNDG